MSNVLEQKIETLQGQVTELQNSVATQIAEGIEKATADLKLELEEKIEKAFASAESTDPKVVEKKPVTPFKSLRLKSGKRNFEFKFPTAKLEINGRPQIFTAEEICEKVNSDIADKLVALYDAGQTLFITELN